MQIDWLTTFLAVVDHGGFHAASEATFRAQSRISAHVASLEREVGAVLLDRSARPVQLTDAGSAFVAHARRTVAALQQGKAAIQAVRGLVSGDIILGTYPSAAAAFVPRLLAEYRDAYPGVHLQLHETATVLLDELLEKGPVELALRPTKPATTRRDLTHRLLWRERMVVVHHPLHRLASCDGNLSLAELEGEGLILTGRSFEHDSEPFLMLMERGVSPVVTYVTNQPQTLVSLVRENLGVAVTNELAVRTSEHAGVMVRRLADETLHRDVGVFWREGMVWSSAARALFELLLITALPQGTQDLRV
ncbi:LysR family transcriptional regulator [Nonomuraea fuscirosea]|uniref:LysR family transcriptional regulator n=1 Tax=Nonomuraea fuscirosea TaxID=1291556 RepID=UPI0034045D4D